MKAKIKAYFWRLLLALDQLFNTVLFGYPDETFSARAYRKAQAGQWFWRKLRQFIDLLFWFDKKHCQSSYEAELERRHSPNEPSWPQFWPNNINPKKQTSRKPAN